MTTRRTFICNYRVGSKDYRIYSYPKYGKYFAYIIGGKYKNDELVATDITLEKLKEKINGV